MTNAETWTKRVAEWRASGLTAREFSATGGFSRSALYEWSSKLGRAEKKEVVNPVRLARVIRRRVRSDFAVLPPAEMPRVLIEHRDSRVFVPPGVDRLTLTTVFEALDARSSGTR